MKTLLMVSVFAVILVGCETPGVTNNRLIAEGQWTPPQQVGQNVFLLGGWDTNDAIKGATSHCQGIGKRMEMSQMVPSTRRTRATVTYSCK